MANWNKRLVVRQHVSKDDVELVAWERDWNLFEVDLEDAGTVSDVWRTDDDETEIRLVDDRSIGMLYLTARGRDVELIERQISGDLDLWSFPDAVRAVRDAPDEDARRVAIFATALTAPDEQDDEVVERFRAIVADPDPRVRHAVVMAVGYRPWPGLIDLVRKLHGDDQDASVRKNAGLLLEGIRLHGETHAAPRAADGAASA